jgi:hypothetical protein
MNRHQLEILKSARDDLNGIFDTVVKAIISIDSVMGAPTIPIPKQDLAEIISLCLRRESRIGGIEGDTGGLQESVDHLGVLSEQPE